MFKSILNCEQEKIVLHLYSNYYNTDKVAEYINMRFGTSFNKKKLVEYCNRRGVKKNKRQLYALSKVTREQEKEMVELYKKGMSSTEIAKLYGYKTRSSVLQKLNKFDTEMRTPKEHQQTLKSYRDFRFDKINSCEKAYFLGLLLTDGYINNDRSLIQLSLTDKDAIEFLSNYTGASYRHYGGSKVTHKDRYVLDIRGDVGDISRLGLIERKSKVLHPPLLHIDEEKYISYILRGVIDGDGWIRKDGKEFFICSMSKQFIEWCIEQLTNLGMKNLKVSSGPNNIYLVRTAYKENILVLKECIYDKPFGMSRKYNKLYE